MILSLKVRGGCSDIHSVMKNLDVDKDVGPDGINPRILHNCYLSFLTRSLCCSTVYVACPVSTLALLLKHVIGSQMYNFIAPFMPQNQYGFV